MEMYKQKNISLIKTSMERVNVGITERKIKFVYVSAIN